MTLLATKQTNVINGFNTMEVFDTLPSMYTPERWQELQAKRRSDLNFEHLYWLSRYDPKPTDGHHLDSNINAKVNASKESCMDLIKPM